MTNLLRLDLVKDPDLVPGDSQIHSISGTIQPRTQCKNWGITGSVVGGNGIKSKLDVNFYETKYEAIMAVEKGVKAIKQIAADFGIPISTLSTLIKVILHQFWVRKMFP